MIRAFIIDDEPAAVRSLQILLDKYCPEISVIGATCDPVEGVNLINTDEPEVLFLDVNMPDMDGFQLLASLENPNLNVVFTTAYDGYAMQAIKVEALDYLLKPIGREDIENAVLRVKKNLEEESSQLQKIKKLLSQIEATNDTVKRISVPTLEGLEFVDMEDIVYCQSDGSYSKIHLSDGTSIMISRPIGYLESKLESATFCRVHHSYVVNVNFVKKYLRGRGGSLVLKTGTCLPVSTRKKSSFLGVV